MKRLFLFGLLCTISLGLLLTACSSRANDNNESEYSDHPEDNAEIVNTIIDWDEVRTTCEPFTSGFEYIDLLEATLVIDEHAKQVIYDAVVIDDADPMQTVSFADLVIRTVNDAAAEQVPQMDLSGTDTHGGIYEDFSYSIKIVPESTRDDESTWFVNVERPAGSPYLPFEVPEYYLNMDYEPTTPATTEAETVEGEVVGSDIEEIESLEAESSQ